MGQLLVPASTVEDKVPEHLSSKGCSRTVEITTARGPIAIKTYCPARLVQELDFDPGLGIFPQYRSIIRSKETLVSITELEDANVVLALAVKAIVGYICFACPDPQERWGKDHLPVFYELGSIEVSRNWRRLGIARAMVEAAMSDEWLEDRIVLLTGFAWHWDLEGTGLDKIGYREMLMHIFERHDFRQYYTNDPDIMMDLANLLMARMGKRVSDADRDRFLDLLFMQDSRWSL